MRHTAGQWLAIHIRALLALAAVLFVFADTTAALAACIPTPGLITFTATGQTSGSIDITGCDLNGVGLYKVQNENSADDAVGVDRQGDTYNTFDTGKARYLAAWDNLAATYRFKLLSIDSGVTSTTDTISLWTPTNSPAADLEVRITVTLPQSLPTVSSLSPTSGPTSGGTTVTITGTGFSTAPGTGAVKFGGTSADYDIISDTQITATAPAGAAGTVDITVTTPGGTSTTTAGDQFTYVALPTLSSVSPNTGPTAGGTSVTLTGTNFTGGTTSVSFGGTSGTITANTGTSLTVTAPAHAAGTVDITVTTPGGTSTTSANDRYTYIAAPTISGITPNTGPTAGGTSVTLTGTNFTNTTSVTFGGTAATGVTFNSTTSLTVIAPVHAAGAVDVVATTPGGTATSLGGFTYAAPPVASSFTATAIAYGSGASSISLTGHATNSPTIYNVGSATTAQGGMVSVNNSGVASYTPPIGFRGNDAFTFTATNAGGTSSPATVTVPVLNPVISITTTLPQGTAVQAYSQNLTASGGKAPYTFSTTLASGSLPAGLTLGSSGVISGTPTAAGDFTFTVTGTDSSTGTGPATFTSSIISLHINAPGISISPTTLPAPVINTAYTPVTFSATGGSGGYTFSLDSGTLPAGMTLTGDTLSGTATAAGNFSFTIKAVDGLSFIGTQSYSFTVDALTAPTANPVSATFAANSSANPVTLDITGAAADTVAVDTQAVHGTATASGTSITYTPTPGYSGSDSFTYTANNGGGTSTPATVSVTVSAPTLALSPVSGSLTAGVVGVAYATQTLTAADGTAPYSYAVTSGSLPAGLTLDADGTLSGTPTASGPSSFTVTATDDLGATGSANYTLAVTTSAAFVFTPSGGALTQAMVGEDYSQSISARGGSGALIYSLASGALPAGMTLNISTGELTGPLADNADARDYAFSIEVRDGNGSTGTASYTLTVKPRAVTVTDKVINITPGSTPADVYLNRGATGGPFVSAETTFVEPANAGKATIIQGELAQSGPVTTPVGWYLHFTPNPHYSGQARVGFRLTSSLGISNTGTVTYAMIADAAQVASDVDQLVHDFVRARQNLIASAIKVPGLLERRQMQQATSAVTGRMMPSENGMTVNFSTSLAQVESARDGGGGASGGYASPFNIWIDGALLAHNDKDVNGGKWGSFAMVNMGADYLLSDKALLGVSFHYDRMTDPTDTDAELTGNGWMAGPYASFEIGKGVFWNTSLLYGGSNNKIDTDFWDGSFDTTRWMVDTSIEGQWNLDQDTTLSPKLRALYFSEKVDDYAVKDSSNDTIAIDGFDEEQFRVSLGAEIARSFTLENGSQLTPKIGVTAGYSGLDGNGIFGSITAGFSLQTANLWIFDAGLLFDIEEEGQKSVGVKGGASRTF